MPAAKRNTIPDDPDAKIPRAVRAASERSEQIFKAAYEKPAPAASPEPVSPVTAEPAPAEPAPPEPDAAAPAVTTEPPSAPPPASENDWKHRYESMKGRHDRLENINRNISGRLSEVETLLASMQTAPPATTTQTTKALLTPDEIKDYGPEFIDLVRRAAAEKYEPVIENLNNKVADLSQRLSSVGTHVAQDARSRMQQALAEALPNWREVNQDERFLNWLALTDTYSGAIRHELLKAAYAANDAPRVLAFFKGFLAEEAAVSPRTTEPGQPPAAPAATKVPLETFAAPGRAKSAATPPVPAEKPSFTRAQVTKFYLDVARGAYAGKDEEKTRLERQIVEAGREGRIS